MRKINTLLFMFFLFFAPCFFSGMAVAGVSGNFQNEMSIEDEKLKIFPNPVKGNKFTVTAGKPIVKIDVHNILGQKVQVNCLQKGDSKYEISFRERKKGVHLVIVVYADKSKGVRRIVVN